MHTIIRSVFALVGLLVLSIEGGAYVTRAGLEAASQPPALCQPSGWSALGPWQPAAVGTEMTYRYRVLGGDTPPCAVQVETLTRHTATGAMTAALSPLPAQDPTKDPLLGPASLAYKCSFRLPGPTGSGEQNTFAYGGEAMAYDAARDSIWITGHDYHDRLAEVTIAACGGRATFKTPWIDMTWRTSLAGSQVNMGGILPLGNGDLILSAYVYYDSAGTQRKSHVRRSAAGAISAISQVGTETLDGVSAAAGFVSGWIIPVPPAWQPLLGCTALTGNGELSIVSRTSHGPALGCFDPATIGQAIAPAKMLLGYPIGRPTLGTCQSGQYFDCASSNRRAGMVWVPGTRSLLHVHQKCDGSPVYQNGGWQCTTSRTTTVLAFDALDLVAVKNGTKQPWEVLPYAAWPLVAPLTSSRMTAVAYDTVRGELILSQDHGDGAQPLMHAVSVTGGGTVPSPTPTPTPTPTPPPTQTVGKVTVRFDPPSPVPDQSTVQAHADILDTAGQPMTGVAVAWSVEHATLADIDQTGHITTHLPAGLTAWSTGIRATAGGVSGESFLRVEAGTAPAPVPDTTIPLVSVTATPTSVTVGEAVSLAATASDNVGVASVEFRAGGAAVGSDTTAPYAGSWVPTAAGAVEVTAVARDAAGNLGHAQPVTVTVHAPAPEPEPEPHPPIAMTTTIVTCAYAARIEAAPEGYTRVQVQRSMDGVTWSSHDRASSSFPYVAEARLSYQAGFQFRARFTTSGREPVNVPITVAGACQ